MSGRTNTLLHTLTLIAIGATAYACADVVHEVLGHGAAAWYNDEKIVLITSVYFRSKPHSFLTDAWGPVANLIAGLVAGILLGKARRRSTYVSLLLIFCAAFNLFWFSWQCLYAGVTNTGDFAFYMSSNQKLLFWRIFLIAAGLSSYWVSIRMIAGAAKKNGASGLSAPRNFLIPYLSAGTAALLGAACYTPYVAETFIQALVLPMFLPVMVIPKLLSGSQPIIDNQQELSSPRQQKLIIISGAIIFILFCALMGRGMRF